MIVCLELRDESVVCCYWQSCCAACICPFNDCPLLAMNNIISFIDHVIQPIDRPLFIPTLKYCLLSIVEDDIILEVER